MSTVAVVTSQHGDEEWIRRAIDGELEVVDSAEVADVIVVSADRYDGVVEHLPASVAVVVIGDPHGAPPPRASHVITQTWPDEQLRMLLVALATGTPGAERTVAAPQSPAEALSAQRVIAAGRKLASATDLFTLETAISEMLVELVEVDRAYCLFHDHEEGALWSEARLRGPGDDRTASSGLAGFVARTGVTAVADSAGDDPRFVGGIDDPSGDSTDHLIAHPVFGSDRTVHAVLICARRARRQPFGSSDIAVLGRFARLVTPILDTLSIDVHAQQILDDAAGDHGLFRRQAMQAQAAPRWGDVIRVSPQWLPWAYWLLVGLLVASGVFVVVGTVATYSQGPAVIRSNARTPISARTAGNVVAVEVVSGDIAAPGTLIARLDDTEQRAAVSNLTQKFEAELRAHMLSNAQTSPALAATRQQLADARAGLDERLIVATTHGVIGDLRVRPGQRIAPGDIVASVVDASMGLELTALLPGEDRPQLQPGMVIRLELDGYRYAYQNVTIDWVSPDVIAPAEARRVIGAEVAESLPLTGPVVLVRGKLPAPDFGLDGARYRYHDGMMGQAKVRVRSEPIVFALLPGTRRLSE